MSTIEVFADITCPFAHVGLRAVTARRAALGRHAPVLHVRAWPLELVDGEPLRGRALASTVTALRGSVAPRLFAGFDPDRFPTTTLPALACAAAAYRHSPEVGERFSLAVREALFEDGLDISEPDVLAVLRRAYDVPAPGPEDDAAVLADLEAGGRLGVIGSPHFFTPHGDSFCPTLRIGHVGDELEVLLDADGVERLLQAALG